MQNNLGLREKKRSTPRVCLVQIRSGRHCSRAEIDVRRPELRGRRSFVGEARDLPRRTRGPVGVADGRGRSAAASAGESGAAGRRRSEAAASGVDGGRGGAGRRGGLGRGEERRGARGELRAGEGPIRALRAAAARTARGATWRAPVGRRRRRTPSGRAGCVWCGEERGN